VLIGAGSAEPLGVFVRAAAVRTPVPVRSAPIAVLVPAACIADLENDAVTVPLPPVVPALNANVFAPIVSIEPNVVLTKSVGQATTVPSVALQDIVSGTSVRVCAFIGLGDMLQ